MRRHRHASFSAPSLALTHTHAMKRERRRDSGQPQARPPSSRGADTFRQEIVALHQAIYRRNKRRINDSVTGYSPNFRRYERSYARAVTHYQQRTSLNELERVLHRSNIVYVGDYHTLSQAQRSFLRLLRRLPSDRPVTIALEFVQGRYQRAIDAYMADQIDEAVFLQHIRHAEDWLLGGWPSFREIFALAKGRGHRIVGIDSAAYKGAQSLQMRDKYAARRIVQAWRAHPNHTIMVLTGELHIAPRHLPQRVQETLPHQTELRSLIIYQNCEKIYEALQAKGLEHEVDVVRVKEGEYCLINTPPIVCQQSFLNWVYVDEDGAQIDAPEQTFKDYARHIARFFNLPLGDQLDEVELTTCHDLSFLQRLAKRRDFSRHDLALIRKQILASESYYIPRAKLVYLGNISVNHASEEATHFLRHVCADMQDPKLLIDAFYARCIEEALGFLGSKVINHKRKCARPGYFYWLRTSRGASPDERKLARLVWMHVRMERGEKVRGMPALYRCDAKMFNMVTHVLGYQLGEKLYYALVQGRLAKKVVHDMFFDTLEEEGTALATYLYLQARTGDVRLPEQF